jgi:protein-disulfide isomerase
MISAPAFRPGKRARKFPSVEKVAVLVGGVTIVLVVVCVTDPPELVMKGGAN